MQIQILNRSTTTRRIVAAFQKCACEWNSPVLYHAATAVPLQPCTMSSTVSPCVVRGAAAWREHPVATIPSERKRGV
jgi:hypothetical protein